MTAREILKKYIPNGCINIKGRNGKSSYQNECDLIEKMLIEFANSKLQEAKIEIAELADAIHIDSKDIIEYSLNIN